MSEKELLLQWVRKNRLENTLLDAVMAGMLELREVNGETLFGVAGAPSSTVTTTAPPVPDALPLPSSSQRGEDAPEPQPEPEPQLEPSNGAEHVGDSGVHAASMPKRKRRRFRTIPKTLDDVEEWGLVVCREHGTHLNCYVSPWGEHVSKEECLCHRGKQGLSMNCPVGEHAGRALVERRTNQQKKGKGRGAYSKRLKEMGEEVFEE